MTDGKGIEIVVRLAARNLRDHLFKEHHGQWFLKDADVEAPSERLIYEAGMDRAIEAAVRATLE